MAPAEADLRPQPGLAQVRSLVDRVTPAGLPVDLNIGSLPEDVPPGVDLAAFRVIQEALTNVIKHAGKPKTSVTVDCREQALVIEITDAGAPIPAAVPAVSGGGRGLIGLRERLALYGGELDAGPVLGGGWRVRARIPLDEANSSPSSAESVSREESGAMVSSPSSAESVSLGKSGAMVSSPSLAESVSVGELVATVSSPSSPESAARGSAARAR
jgi:hypothetical protein